MTDLRLVIASRSGRRVRRNGPGSRQATPVEEAPIDGINAGKVARADAAIHPGAWPTIAGRVTLAPLRKQRADDNQGRAHQCCQARQFSEE